jgi:hypothetical protein
MPGNNLALKGGDGGIIKPYIPYTFLYILPGIPYEADSTRRKFFLNLRIRVEKSFILWYNILVMNRTPGFSQRYVTPRDRRGEIPVVMPYHQKTRAVFLSTEALGKPRHIQLYQAIPVPPHKIKK